MRAVRQHTDCKWALLYIERWLKAPVSMPDGTLVSREGGTPQGLGYQPCVGEPFSSLCVRPLDAKGAPGYPVRALCRKAFEQLAGSFEWHSAEPAQHLQSKLIFPAKPPTDPEIDSERFRSDWHSPHNLYDFSALLACYRLNHAAAFRLIGEHHARRSPVSS